MNQSHSQSQSQLQQKRDDARKIELLDYTPSFFETYIDEDGQIKHKYTYIMLAGGRSGGCKTHQTALALLIKSLEPEKYGWKPNAKIYCARQYETTLDESVYSTIVKLIYQYNLQNRFTIQHNKIFAHHTCGSANKIEFRFVGCEKNPQSLRGIDNVAVIWFDEAQHMSQTSWDDMLPTVLRNPSAQVILTMNPRFETDIAYQEFFVRTPPENSFIKTFTWRDNPYMTKDLLLLMERDKKYDYAKYENKWEGKLLKNSDSHVFNDRWSVVNFDEPKDVKILFGADWGYYPDPTVGLRGFVYGNTLHITHEAYAHKLLAKDIGAFFEAKLGLRRGVDKIICDSNPSNYIPELKSHGYNAVAAKKYGGSVEAGITGLKNFHRILIRPSCENTIYEFSNFALKVDKKTEQILPVYEPNQADHCIDAARYMIDDLIGGRHYNNYSQNYQSSSAPIYF